MPTDIDGVFALKDRTKIHVSVMWGDPDKTPVLLFGGIGTNLETWPEEFRKRLGRTSVAFDLPSQPLHKLYKGPFWELERNAARIDEMLSMLKIKVVDEVGVSLGGAHAQEQARGRTSRLRPDPVQVRRIVLAATMSGFTALPGSPRAMANMARMKLTRSDDRRRALGAKVYGGDVGSHPEYVDLIHGANKPSKYDLLYRSWSAFAWSSLRWLPDVTQPTLVLWGSHDPIVRPWNAHQLINALPNAIGREVKNGSHIFLLTDYEVQEDICKFFDSDDPMVFNA